jgi:sec-independent protein translocase protein TatC
MSNELTLWRHFDELRKRIIASIYGLAVAFLVASIWTKQIANFLFKPYYQTIQDPSYKLAYTSITDVFIFYFKMITIVAIFVSAPWFFYQLWLFISPALRKREKRAAVPFILFTSLFFMCGMLFSFYVVLPLTFKFFFELNRDYKNVVTISSIFNFEFIMILGIGLCFETPIIIFLLTRLGILTKKMLLKYSRWAILFAFIISAVITPSGDPFTQTVIALPIVVLYFLGILFSAIFPHSKKVINEDDK